MTVADRLTKYLEVTEKTVTQLSKEIKVSQSSLSNVARGDTNPGYRLLIPLSKTGIDIHWLLTGQGAMMRQDYDKKIINEGNITNQFGGNNNTGISNKLNTSTEKLAYLEDKIEYLERQLADKDKIIKLLEER